MPCSEYRVQFVAILLLSLVGCTSTGELQDLSGQKSLPVIPGVSRLEVGKIKQANVNLPSADNPSQGGVLKFSPIEFRSDKSQLVINAAGLPLGRYIMVRDAGEDLTQNLGDDEVRSFHVRYNARFPDRAMALQAFPHFPVEQIRDVSLEGKPMVELEQWRLRLVMILSKNRKAFRVLMDNVEYYSPTVPPQETDSEFPVKAKEQQGLPVIVAFSYNHPNSVTETLIQQNIIFRFKVNTNNGLYAGTPQISGWLPLPENVASIPYTIGIMVAELHEKHEDSFKSLLKVIKDVRSVI